MEQMHGMDKKKPSHSHQPDHARQSPSAPEYVVKAEELERYKVLRDEIRKAKKELEEESP